MALKSDGTVWTWGENEFGVLGIGPGGPNFVNRPVQVSVLSSVTAISASSSHAMALKSDGSVQIVCGTPGSVIHYTTNGSDPTESDPVITSGDFVMVDHSLTLKARAFRSGFTTSAVKSAIYNVGAPAPLELLLDFSGPALDQAAAFDLLTLIRDLRAMTSEAKPPKVSFRRT